MENLKSDEEFLELCVKYDSKKRRKNCGDTFTTFNLGTKMKVFWMKHRSFLLLVFITINCFTFLNNIIWNQPELHGAMSLVLALIMMYWIFLCNFEMESDGCDQQQQRQCRSVPTVVEFHAVI